MKIKELKSKVKALRNEAANLETVFHNAVLKYLNTIIGVASCESDKTNKKVCLEEIYANYNSDSDLVTIEYVIMNKYGDFGETKQIMVNASEIDKYMLC